MTKKPKKIRLDELLVEQGVFPDAGTVLRAVLAHEVKVDDVYVTSAAVKVAPDAEIVVRGRKQFVSRGGHKLQGALDAFGQDVIVCDVSFIGLAVLAPAFARLSRPASDGASASVFLGLVKPQFESRHDETDHGIVRDEAVRARTVEEVRCALEREGFEVTGTIESPIKGAEGNVEYLVRAVFQG